MCIASFAMISWCIGMCNNEMWFQKVTSTYCLCKSLQPSIPICPPLGTLSVMLYPFYIAIDNSLAFKKICICTKNILGANFVSTFKYQKHTFQFHLNHQVLFKPFFREIIHTHITLTYSCKFDISMKNDWLAAVKSRSD